MRNLFLMLFVVVFSFFACKEGEVGEVNYNTYNYGGVDVDQRGDVVPVDVPVSGEVGEVAPDVVPQEEVAVDVVVVPDVTVEPEAVAEVTPEQDIVPQEEVAVDVVANGKCENEICLYYDSPSQTVVLTGDFFAKFGKAVFFTGMPDAPYPNVEVGAIVDSKEFISYFPAPKEKVYKLFNLTSSGTWMLVDAKTKNPPLGNGLEYYCENGCAILISERK